MNIAELYFVEDGFLISEEDENIFQRVVPNKIPEIVKSGDTFTINRQDLGFEPLKNKEDTKDVIIVYNDGGEQLKPVRYGETFVKKEKAGKILIKVPNRTWTYKEKDKEQLKNWFDRAKKYHLGFRNFREFEMWHNEQEKMCHYCGLTEKDSQRLVHDGVLISNRFPIYGVTSRGVNRGYWLEIDRRNPKGKYDKENCVLSCYFCNNDKSDVFSNQQYKDFVNDRPGFIKGLLNKQNEK